MKATELRVTNFVEHFGNYKPVAMIGYDAILLYEKNGNVTQVKLDEINPIPITEELLKKLNFKITGETKEENPIWTFFGEKSKFNIEQIGKGFFLHDNRCFGTQIKCFHQLQNLFFALTGFELEYSPK